MNQLSDDLLDMSIALASALTSSSPKLLRATAALVAENIQKSAIKKAEELERPQYILKVHEDGQNEVIPIDLRGIIPHKGKVS